MSKKVPKLTLRQGPREKTPPPLVKWDLNDLEQERWKALTQHHNSFAKSSKLSTHHQPSNIKITPPRALPDPKAKQGNLSARGKEITNKSISPAPLRNTQPRSQSKNSGNTIFEPGQIKRPLLMPSLEVNDNIVLPNGNSLLEKAERNAASEPIDQNSLRFQVKLRKNVEAIHEEDLKAREEQWKEKISKTRDNYEKIKKRNIELEEVMKRYQVGKVSTTEASKEISRLLELKAKTSDEINILIFRKTELEKTINDLHLELEKISLNHESQEKNLSHEIENLKRQITMSENEKIDTVAFNKENLTKRKNELLARRQQLIEKWQTENTDFRQIFSSTDEKKKEIRLQLDFLKAEKEMMKKEKEDLDIKESLLKQEMDVAENNKKTIMLYHNFLDPKMLKNKEALQEIISKCAKLIVDKNKDSESVLPMNEFAQYLLEIKQSIVKRRKELLSNSVSQISILEEQMNNEKLKANKSTGNLSALKRMINNLPRK
ncbi:hypothetical protein SteCoe_3762 [Stentor coeruleus]|uniref:Uncharacterized protein n=1 Tax=Stentor coeruleus TaxID=5963 RepID=A0A1R2CWB5_9CILI|nr:hypothetical protein SteCoe_3762 [Stentor coeruleus]